MIMNHIPLFLIVRFKFFNMCYKGGRGRKGGQIFPLGVPSKGQGTLTGESPVMVKAGSHVAWMAGGDGNVVF